MKKQSIIICLIFTLLLTAACASSPEEAAEKTTRQVLETLLNGPNAETKAYAEDKHEYGSTERTKRMGEAYESMRPEQFTENAWENMKKNHHLIEYPMSAAFAKCEIELEKLEVTVGERNSVMKTDFTADVLVRNGDEAGTSSIQGSFYFNDEGEIQASEAIVNEELSRLISEIGESPANK